MNHPFPVGTPILVVGNVCRVTTCAGLPGYVTATYPGQTAVNVRLLSQPTIEDPNDAAREARGSFRTRTAIAQPGDLRPLTDPSALARVEALRQADAAVVEDPKVEEIIAEMTSDKAIKQHQRKQAAIAARSAKMGRVFDLPGYIARGDKSRYPTFDHPAVQAISDELKSYAARGPSKCSLNERARWSQANVALSCASFWSPRQECRAVVKEMDLDPFADTFEDALWQGRAGVYAPNGTLRRVVVELWNRGAQILEIEDMAGPDTCWNRLSPGEPSGFMVSYAFRRHIPLG